MTILYGIKNCDRVKKAQNSLKEQNITFTFHDFRKDGIEAEKISHWIEKTSLEEVINKRSTTWKNLTTAEQSACHTTKTAIAVLASHPTLIKRPILEINGQILIGDSLLSDAQK